MMGRCIGLKVKKIKKLNELNLLFIEEVFKDYSDLHGAIIASANSKRNCGIFEFSIGKSKQIIASSHESEWHPHCVYTQLAYDLNEPDLQQLQSCIEFLRNEFDKPLFFLIDERFSTVASILVEQDYRMIRKTDMVHISPEKHNNARASSLATITQINDDAVLMNSLVELSKSTYTETHMSNPVGDHSMQVWRDIILDGLLKDHSYVVLEGKEVIAFSFMYEGDKNSWELGWIGVNELSNLSLLDTMLAQQLTEAKERNISFIEKEVDSTCPYSLHICQSVKYEVVETLFAYMNLLDKG